MFTLTLGILAAAYQPATVEGGQDIVVNTTLDNDQPDAFCSLREAIIASNTNTDYHGCTHAGPGADRIRFSLPTAPATINIVTKLPVITDTVDINGGSADVQDVPAVELRGPGGSIISGEDGLTISAADTRIVNLAINSFRDRGILILANNVQLLSNYIGTDVTGMTAQPNAGYGVQVVATGATIGGMNGRFPDGCSSGCNVISGNAKEDILVDVGASGTVISGNFIGMNATGTAAIDEGPVPLISVKGLGTHIGGNQILLSDSCGGSCNLIAGSNWGIHMEGNANGTHIDGNFIGVDVTGTQSLGAYQGAGIWDETGHTVIGMDAGNVIGGFNYGILAEDGNMFIHHNYIGTNAEGAEGLANIYGIGISGPASKIDQGNVISHNGFGVVMTNATQTTIAGNFIRLNSGTGIRLGPGAQHNAVGDVGAGNFIYSNTDNGISVDDPTAFSNIITENSIHDNDGFGVQLSNGGNAELPAPVITAADASGANGTACGSCSIEVFSDGEDEGETYEGRVMADAGGNWAFSGSLGGPNVTATAMDSTLFNTSGFSVPFVIFSPTPSPTPTSSPTPTPTATPATTYKQGDVNCDGHIDEQDFRQLLRFAAALISGVQPDCFEIGEALSQFGTHWV